MATKKQIDNALKVLNNMLDTNYEVGYDGVNLYYKYKGGITRRNIFITNPTKTNILDIIWAMQTAVDISRITKED